MRVVLDTNVLVSATLIFRGKENRILDAWRRGAFDLVFSAATLEELFRVLSYPKLRKHRWLTDEEVVMLLEELASQSILVRGEVTVTASRDPEDDKFLSTAIEGGADFVVTGDKDLLSIDTFGKIRVVTPAHFLEVLP